MYVKIKNKHVNELEKGDILFFKKHWTYYKLNSWFEEEEGTKHCSKKDCYFNFNSFLVHGHVLTNLFETCGDGDLIPKKLVVYKQVEDKI
jgi:hypothetical protein